MIESLGVLAIGLLAYLAGYLHGMAEGRHRQKYGIRH